MKTTIWEKYAMRIFEKPNTTGRKEVDGEIPKSEARIVELDMWEIEFTSVIRFEKEKFVKENVGYRSRPTDWHPSCSLSTDGKRWARTYSQGSTQWEGNSPASKRRIGNWGRLHGQTASRAKAQQGMGERCSPKRQKNAESGWIPWKWMWFTKLFSLIRNIKWHSNYGTSMESNWFGDAGARKKKCCQNIERGSEACFRLLKNPAVW